MRMRLTALVVTATALLAAAVAAPPATATALHHVHRFEGTNCEPDAGQHRLCMFGDHGFKGGGVALEEGAKVSRLGDFGFDNTMSSWVNDTQVRCTWFTDNDFKGTGHELKPGQRAELGPDEDNTASSVSCEGPSS